jgi:hypothetical protein
VRHGTGALRSCRFHCSRSARPRASTGWPVDRYLVSVVLAKTSPPNGKERSANRARSWPYVCLRSTSRSRSFFSPRQSPWFRYGDGRGIHAARDTTRRRTRSAPVGLTIARLAYAGPATGRDGRLDPWTIDARLSASSGQADPQPGYLRTLIGPLAGARIVRSLNSAPLRPGNSRRLSIPSDSDFFDSKRGMT